MKIELDSMVWMGRPEVSALGKSFARLRAVFQVKPKQFGRQAIQPINQFIYDEQNERIGLPLWAGLRMTPEEWGIDNRLSRGLGFKARSFPDPHHPKAPPGQEEFFNDLLNAMRDQYTVMAQAPTGAGKTVAALNTIGTLGRTAIVVVPSEFLAEQWAAEAQRHLGMEPSEIGILKGASVEWEGKHLVIALIHNLVFKTWPEEFGRYFGCAVFDEAHRLGAREFSKAVQLFPAKYKLALTATPDRRDGCEKLFLDYFGPVTVESRQQVLPVKVKLIPFSHTKVPRSLGFCEYPTRALQFLSTCDARNQEIVRLIAQQYDQGRNILVLSKFIPHVERLIFMCREMGIPEEHLGQFTRSTTSKRRIKQAQLDEAKMKPVCIGTYNMLREGVDVPQWDTGIEALPTADVRQAVGRIRRLHPGKPQPYWFTFIDESRSPSLAFLRGYSVCRLRGLANVGCVVEE